MTDYPAGSKEKAILEAASKRFAYYGFSKVTMDEIATDVAMGKASLYYYFPTKENLFKAVLAQEKDLFLCEMRTVLQKTANASEQLRAYVQNRLELFRRLVNLSTLAVDKEADLITPFGEFFIELEKDEMKLILQILQAGKREGEFALAGMQQTAEVILHVLHGLRLRAIKKAQRTQLDNTTYHNLKQEGKLIVELLLQGITKRN